MKNIKVTLVSLLLSLYLINHLDAGVLSALTGAFTKGSRGAEISSFGSTGRESQPIKESLKDPQGLTNHEPPFLNGRQDHLPTPVRYNPVNKPNVQPVDPRIREACRQACMAAADAAVHEAVDSTNSCYAKVISSGINSACASACFSPRAGFEAAKKEGIKAAKKCIKEAANKANAPAAAEAYPPPADAYPPYADAYPPPADAYPPYADAYPPPADAYPPYADAPAPGPY